VALQDGAEAIAASLAIWMLQATTIPIDFRLNAKERNQLAKEFDMTVILEDRLLPMQSYQPVLLDDAWSETIAKHSNTPLWNGEPTEAPALISLTSGTTARPLGVVLDHERMLLRSLSDCPKSFGSLFLNPLPLSFSASRTFTFAALLQGVCVLFTPVIIASQELAQTIVSRGVTSCCTVPTIVRGLLDLELALPRFDQLQAIFCLGAPMHPEEKLKAKTELSANFIQEYGSSLVGRISSLGGSDLETRATTVGRVLPQVCLQIVDDNDNVLPSGESGTIRLRSAGMALALEGPTRHSGDKLKDGWVYPGDIASMDVDGFLTLLGRTSDLIVRGGANVHPSEIEAAVAEHPNVLDVAAVGFSSVREGEEIGVFVVPAGELSESSLIGHCRAYLSPDKRPRKFVFVTELPRNANGKLLRTELRKMLEAESRGKESSNIV
jgi:acyl-CoA synthetase (AMP-forming)/AMP-acid ligase II